MAVFWDAAEEGGGVYRCRGSALTTMIDRRWNSNGGAAEVSPEFAHGPGTGALTKSERRHQ